MPNNLLNVFFFSFSSGTAGFFSYGFSTGKGGVGFGLGFVTVGGALLVPKKLKSRPFGGGGFTGGVVTGGGLVGMGRVAGCWVGGFTGSVGLGEPKKLLKSSIF
jgi:hypothetical protein